MQTNSTSKNSNKTEVIECNGQGYQALVGSVLQGRYKIGNFIDKGNQGSIYEVTENQKSSTKMIIKVSEDYDSITEEIKVLKKLRKSQKTLYGEQMRKYIPQCFNFGMIVVSNFTYNQSGVTDSSKATSTDSSKEDSRLLGYFIMRRYDQNLEKFVCKSKNLHLS